MTTLVNGLGQPFAALQALLKAEEDEEVRPKLSTVSWFADVWRVKSSTIPRVWKPVLCITVWSALVAVLDLIYDRALGLSNSVVPLLSIVVGLLLVFRNGTAYGRWSEGRQLFSSMSNGVRNLARLTWCGVGSADWDPARLEEHNKSHKMPWQVADFTKAHREEKIAALRMMVAFVIASKHHVREEYDNDQYEDLTALLPRHFLTHYKTKSHAAGYGAMDSHFLRNKPSLRNRPSYASVRSAFSVTSSTPNAPRSPARGAATGPSAPLLAQQEYEEAAIVHKMVGRPSLPLPIIIAHKIQLYFAKCKAQGHLESIGPAGYNTITQTISTLVNDFTAMERLLTLPLPTIYGVHLKQTVTLYLVVLPLVLVEVMSWKMIPAVTLVAFTLMGIEGIASEIEFPFGEDASDLPLEYLCAELRNEIEQMMARLPETPQEDFMY